MPMLSVSELRILTLDILEKLGTPADFARVVCDNLVGANLVGHDSHGVLRLISYAQFVRDGLVVPRAAPVVVRRARRHGARGRLVGVGCGGRTPGHANGDCPGR